MAVDIFSPTAVEETSSPKSELARCWYLPAAPNGCGMARRQEKGRTLPTSGLRLVPGETARLDQSREPPVLTMCTLVACAPLSLLTSSKRTSVPIFRLSKSPFLRLSRWKYTSRPCMSVMNP